MIFFCNISVYLHFVFQDTEITPYSSTLTLCRFVEILPCEKKKCLITMDNSMAADDLATKGIRTSAFSSHGIDLVFKEISLTAFLRQQTSRST